MSETVLIQVPHPSLFIGYVSVLPVKVSFVDVLIRVQLLFQVPLPEIVESNSVDHCENVVFCDCTQFSDTMMISRGTIFLFITS
jgi:hypothetical protein